MKGDVRVEKLVKRYPKSEVNAVDELSFEIEEGEIFGLLGPNGAGKSTTIGVLTTRVKATSGTAAVGGVDVMADPVGARRLLAAVPQQVNLDRALTPRQNLIFHAAYHGSSPDERKTRAAELLEEFGLGQQADTKVDWYSGGMAQRLMIARAMMHAPTVLFLDEPTAGLDPQSRLFLWERVRELREKGTTIVLTTHDMDEAAEMSDRVGIVDHGRLLALDAPSALTNGLAGEAVLEIEVEAAPNDSAEELAAVLMGVSGVVGVEEVAGGAAGMPPAALAAMAGGGSALGGPMPAGPPPGPPPASGTTLRLYVDRAPASILGPVATLLAARGAEVTSVRIGEPSLEDVFIELTGRSLR